MAHDNDKWAEWNKLKSPAYADKWLREQRGITLHAGSTKEEIDRAVRAVRIYRASIAAWALLTISVLT